MFRRFVAAVLALTLPFAAAAQTAGAVVESLRGVAQVGNAEVKQGQRLAPTTALSTQAGAQAFLRFDDGMQVVLAESSLLRIVDFRYGGGQGDRAVLELLRGSARVVTGQVAANDASQFFFRTPQAEFKVEDASDFSVALVNPAYVMVHSGRVVAGNGQGTTVLNRGSTSVIASGNSVPAPIAMNAMPPVASSALNNLSVVAMGSPYGGSMAGFGGVGGAAQAAHQWLILALVAAAVIVVVAAQDDDKAATSHH